MQFDLQGKPDIQSLLRSVSPLGTFKARAVQAILDRYAEHDTECPVHHQEANRFNKGAVRDSAFLCRCGLSLVVEFVNRIAAGGGDESDFIQVALASFAAVVWPKFKFLPFGGAHNLYICVLDRERGRPTSSAVCFLVYGQSLRGQMLLGESDPITHIACHLAPDGTHYAAIDLNGCTDGSDVLVRVTLAQEALTEHVMTKRTTP